MKMWAVFCADTNEVRTTPIRAEAIDFADATGFLVLEINCTGFEKIDVCKRVTHAFIRSEVPEIGVPE